MSSLHVCCHCDNTAVVAMINRHTSRHPVATHLLRCFFFICARYAVSLTAEHLSGHLNGAADALSRFSIPAFWRTVPYAETCPYSIHPELLDILVHHWPNWLAICRMVRSISDLSLLRIGVRLYEFLDCFCYLSVHNNIMMFNCLPINVLISVDINKK